MASTTPARTAQRPPFPGRIGRTIADSQPWWPPRPGVGARRANVLVILFDDVGFADFGCYGSSIATPAIDAIAAQGLRLTGFHTTAMCSTTRAALLTGCNHHSVGMGCLANFDSGYPGYRGKIAPNAATLAEMLRPHGYVNYMLGKWHVTSLNETGPTGPFDGWPLGRGYDRFYGFLDAETDQFAPELVRDNTHVTPPGSHEDGYHLSEDLVDESIRYLAEHVADQPGRPWHLWLAFGAAHAPHQAPREMVLGYDPLFADGWDAERERRLARQLELGIVPPGTQLPPRNEGVKPWHETPAELRPFFVRLQAAYAAMLEHADRQIARLMAFLDATGQRDDTIVVVLSDNGASQEGGPLGFVNAMGPFNHVRELPATKLARIEDIGGPATHSNYPWGWAMAGNTPLKRYKQNTHGGGIRDPFVIAWPKGLAGRGELRHGFLHASDLAPTLLELLALEPPATIRGEPCLPLEGESFAALLHEPDAPARARAQYFEMFGHRGVWDAGWKAVAWHRPGSSFDEDRWELYHLETDFAENEDLAAREPQRLHALVERWWAEAERCQVLPLDDRFGPRFAENGRRVQGERREFVLHAGMGHLPTDVAPDIRSRDYEIEAHARIDDAHTQGVLVAHGDGTSGYSLFVRDGRLVHDMNLGGTHHVVVSERRLEPGWHRLAMRFRVDRAAAAPQPLGRGHDAPAGARAAHTITLLVDDEPSGFITVDACFNFLVSWSGLDIGLDRGSPVSDYAAPFAFSGELRKVTVRLGEPAPLDGDAVGAAQMARQ